VTGEEGDRVCMWVDGPAGDEADYVAIRRSFASGLAVLAGRPLLRDWVV